MTTSTTANWTIHHFVPGGKLPGWKRLEALRTGELGLVRLQGMLNPVALSSLQARLDERRAEATVNSYPNADLITFGPYLAKHLKSPTDYFTRVLGADELFPEPDLDLRAQVRQTLAHLFDLQSLQVAREPDGRRYAAAVVRMHPNGAANPLHNDHIARDAAGTGLLLSGLRAQFSCVVCLQECTIGGELELYQKVWEPKDERFKIQNGLGYDEQVVAGVERLTFKPQTGDVYIMNPTYYHAINKVGGAERRTLGFFFGLLRGDNRDGVAWS